MSGGGFWTNILMGVDDEVSLEDFSLPMTQDTQADEEVCTEVEAFDVQACVGGCMPTHYKAKLTESNQTVSSIMHRWMHILEQVNNYYGCYEAIECRNQSGSTIQDKVSVSHLFYLPIR